jgi:quercetin dioxygenase-like cupin family protein
MSKVNGFTDVTRNTNGILPRPAQQPDDGCLHAGVVAGGVAAAFSSERGHPVFPVRLPGRSVSLSIGRLAPGASTSNHRHAYEALVLILAGQGHTMIEGRRFDWRAGDAIYTPPWCWHQHVASGDGRVEYVTATNLPALEAMGQTVLREEEL